MNYIYKNKKTGLYYRYDSSETEDVEKAYSYELTIKQANIYVNNGNLQTLYKIVPYNQELRSIKLQKLNELHI